MGGRRALLTIRLLRCRWGDMGLDVQAYACFECCCGAELVFWGGGERIFHVEEAVVDVYGPCFVDVPRCLHFYACIVYFAGVP